MQYREGERRDEERLIGGYRPDQEDFPLDASLGSHFFHNVTSMDVGYFSVNHTSLADRINWEVLKKQKVVKETNYFKHVRFDHPVEIMKDGKQRKSVITWKAPKKEK